MKIQLLSKPLPWPVVYQRKETVHARRRARPHQGVRLLRLLHRPGRAAADADARRRLSIRAAVQPMCGCTDLGHDDVRRLIVAKELKTIPAVMQELEWKTSVRLRQVPAGAQLLPALRPGPANIATTSQSRFINERVHANIQKDGTYSVVPRMWGGVTTPNELRAIADVVDKFTIPTVKVTGGQRIDLLGVKKEDLPAVWADLNAAGMVSGHAYAKGLRTVKTCVGSEWCRFGTQDSTGAGRQAREVHVGLVDAGQGQDRRCPAARATAPKRPARTSASICVDCGYEIHFAGAAGLDIKGTEVLGQGRDRGGGARSHRRADAALPRAGLVPGAHLQVGRARRPRRRSAGRSSTTSPTARRCSTASSISQQFAQSRSLGRARRRQATRTSSAPSSTAAGRAAK